MPVNATGQQRVSQIETVPAPTKGLNDIDPLAAMDPSYALILDNFFPATSAITTRAGYQEFCTGIKSYDANGNITTHPAPIKTLIPYYGVDGSSKLFACTDWGIYDVSISRDNPPRVVEMLDGECQYTQYNTDGVTVVYVVNGIDPPMYYDGTDWIITTQFQVPQVPSADGACWPERTALGDLNMTAWISCLAYKRILYFVEANSTKIWYMGVDSLFGSVKLFDVGSVFKRGGSIVEVINWSMNEGDGLHNTFAIRSSVGEIVVYQGDDPDSTGDFGSQRWELQASFFISAPVGYNQSVSYGGDAIMVTRMGIVPLSSVVQGEATDALYEGILSSRNISRTLSRILRKTKATDWELVNAPYLQALILTIPDIGNGVPVQYVMNALTGAWCRFNLPAISIVVSNQQLFFGTADGTVCIYGEGMFLDDVKLDRTGGVEIEAEVFTAYNYFGEQAANKHYKLCRPIFQADKPVAYALKLNLDYNNDPLFNSPLPAPGDTGFAIWGAATNAALWGTSTPSYFWTAPRTVYRPWTGVVGLGFSAALLVRVLTNSEVSLVATEFVYENGAAI